MGFVGSVEDRLALRELYGVYSDATMRQDRNLYLSLWCEDATRISGADIVSGVDEIATHWDRVWGGIKKMGFFSEIAGIQVDGATATVQVNCREIVVLQDGNIWKVIGRYDDILEKSNGRWLFKKRDYRILMNESGVG